MHGGTRYIRLVTRVAAPRCTSMYSSELPPSVSTSTDQAIAPSNAGVAWIASVSSSASGSTTTKAAISCTVLAVRTSQGATKRFWYSVPTVMASSAIRHSARFCAVTSPWPSLFHTTSSNPARPSPRPSHWRGATRCSWPVADTHSAVSTGCRPTISAVVPAPMPSLTALHTPPR